MLPATSKNIPGQPTFCRGKNTGVEPIQHRVLKGLPVILTDTQIRHALPQDPRYRLSDGENGLCLCVYPEGGKYFVFRFTWQGSDAELALGAYGKKSLKQARLEAQQAQELLSQGVDPRAHRRAQKAIQRPTFREVAEEWYTMRTQPRPKGTDKTQLVNPLAPKTMSKIRWILNAHLHTSVSAGDPGLADRYLDEITSPQLLATLRAIKNAGLQETAHRALVYARQIFDYGDGTGRLPGKNPADSLRRALAPLVVTHHPTIKNPEGIGQLLLAIESYSGEQITRIALEVMPRTITRSQELRYAEWPEIRWEDTEWHIPGERMKMKLPHIVPLSPQVLVLLRRLQAITGHHRYLFPSLQRPGSVMSENTLGKALRILGYAKGTMTAHGFRSAASTRLNESSKWRKDAIERQLAHCEQDQVRAAYNYAEYLPERRRMMKWWSDYLDKLREAARERAKGNSRSLSQQTTGLDQAA